MWQRRLISLSYQGTAYSGFSSSPNCITVKDTLYHSIFSILPKATTAENLGFQYSSRTDKGVHALDQKCSFLLPSYFSDIKAMQLLNERLPGDMKIVNMVSVDNSFVLRDVVLGKDYYYWLSFGPRDPFFSSLRWSIPCIGNLDSAQQYCSLLVGEHDFSYFAKNMKQYKSTVCRIYKAEIRVIEQDQWLLQIRGNRFLHHMIRFITGFLYAWLKSKKPIPNRYEDLFTLTCQASSLLAPGGGLYLVKTWLSTESDPLTWHLSPYDRGTEFLSHFFSS